MPISFSALLLAGGKSSRMGRDKAFLLVDGQPLWQRQISLLTQLQPNETFIAGPAREEWKDYELIADAQSNAGPLGGLMGALRRCASPLLLVLAVDLPSVTANYLAELLRECSETCGVIPHLANRFEPLAAIYPCAAMPIAEDSLASGEFSLQQFARRCLDENLLQVKTISDTEKQFFFNMNTPEDLLARETEIIRIDAGAKESQRDDLAAEEPLEIRVEGHSVAVVMRTPGHDRELAAGFLLTENLIRSSNDIFDVTQCGSSATDHVINVTLRNPGIFDPAKLTRNVFSSSSCGVCSKATIEAVRQTFAPIDSNGVISTKILAGMPARLREKQEMFARTGGLHACALFDLAGELLALREDVGRHNALDKLIGRALLDRQLPLRDRVLFLSGRVSFEMMQKALAAGIPIVAAISAPTSLAVEFAQENNQTLAGFVRGQTMNIYAGAERVAG